MLELLLALHATVFTSQSERQDWTPDKIVWQQVNADGTKYALLEGRRDEPGVAFTYAFFIPAGVWDGPHSHSADARVVVVKGRLKLGYGRMLDKITAREFPLGAYLLVPAGAVHFDGADEDTIIIGTAVGPWRTQYVK
jgi:quercetin dioxygenase-like cupin family protein